jgi:FkbM family methyltransferase
MGIRRVMVGVVNGSLRRMGYEIHRTAFKGAFRKTRLLKAAARFKDLSSKPVFLDIGARDGLAWDWAELTRSGLVRGVAVELDPSECKRLQEWLPPLIILNYALGPESGKRKLYITRASGCTSFLEPNAEVLCEYEVRAYFDLLRTVEIDVVAYESLVLGGKAPRPNFVKIDVQGFEREVLKGFGSVLEDVVAVEMEGHFRPIYLHQWTAPEMIEQMRAWGFILREIRQQGFYEGEFVEGNFYFSRVPKKLDEDRLSMLKVWESVEGIQPAYPYVPVPENDPSTQLAI